MKGGDQTPRSINRTKCFNKAREKGANTTATAQRCLDADDLFALQRLEIELLAGHLNRHAEERTLLDSILPIAGECERGKLMQLGQALGLSYSTENQ